MTHARTLFKRLDRLDSTRFRAVARRLTDQPLQSLVLRAARDGGTEEVALVRELLQARRPNTSEPSKWSNASASVEMAPDPETTWLSWRDLAGLPGGDQLIGGLDVFFEMLEPIQHLLRTTSIDAFGVELDGVESLLERISPMRELTWDAVVRDALGPEGFELQTEAAGLGATWFSRGPYVRRRPFLYVVGGGSLTFGDGDDTDGSIAPFVARYNGSDAEVTPGSWTEWFTSVSAGPGRFRIDETDLSMSFFRSADGPLDLFGQLYSDLTSLAGRIDERNEVPGWHGWSVEIHPDAPQRRALELGASFYG